MTNGSFYTKKQMCCYREKKGNSNQIFFNHTVRLKNVIVLLFPNLCTHFELTFGHQIGTIHKGYTTLNISLKVSLFHEKRIALNMFNFFMIFKLSRKVLRLNKKHHSKIYQSKTKLKSNI